jgi:hypothetical protein
MSANKTGLTINGETGKAIDTPRLLRTPPIKLDSLKSVREEAGRVYREMRTGKVDKADGTKLIFVLDVLRRMIEADELERRVSVLEGMNNEND